MSINDNQRQQLMKTLSSSLANASGYSANVSDVAQWDVAADAIIRTIEGLIDAKMGERHAEDRGATEASAAG